jgi:hypothetical protein
VLLRNLKVGGQGPICAVEPLDGWIDGWTESQFNRGLIKDAVSRADFI